MESALLAIQEVIISSPNILTCTTKCLNGSVISKAARPIEITDEMRQTAENFFSFHIQSISFDASIRANTAQITPIMPNAPLPSIMIVRPITK